MYCALPNGILLRQINKTPFFNSVIPVHALKADREVEVQLQAFFNSELDARGSSALSPGNRAYCIQRTGVFGPHSRSFCSGGEKTLLLVPRIETRTLSRPAVV